jgi:GrpB-like predicted nucleotidyltransferase (UPF0157 family)
MSPRPSLPAADAAVLGLIFAETSVTCVMLPGFPVILAAYDPEWPHMAARLADDLRVLDATLQSVHHIGSTAVPGLIAKPIIDLVPLVKSLADLDLKRPQVEALGYGWHGEYGIEGRRFCTLCDDTGTRIAHLHFFAADSPHAERHIAFRDYLRAYPHVADAYAAEKRRARDLHPDDSNAYASEKSAWVRAAETKAFEWFAARHAARDLRTI